MKIIRNQEELKREVSKTEKEYIKNFVRTNYNFGSGCKVKEQLENLKNENLLEFIKYLEATFILLYSDYKKRTSFEGNIKDVVKFLGQGFFSSAFLIGDNVLKMGYTTAESISEEIDSPASIKVYFRKIIPLYNNLNALITIMPYVQTKKFDDEDVYDVFKRLRDSGYLWNDPTPDNIGILLPNHTSDFMGVKYDSLKEGQVPGDLVVFDLDDMCNLNKFSKDELHWVGDDITFDSYNPRVYRFEKRYEEETQTDIKIL